MEVVAKAVGTVCAVLIYCGTFELICNLIDRHPGVTASVCMIVGGCVLFVLSLVVVVLALWLREKLIKND